MARKPGTPLAEVAEFPAEAAGRLAALWLTTAEEFATTAARPGGGAMLANHLGLRPEAIEPLMNAAARFIPDGVAFGDDSVPVAFGALPVEGGAIPEEAAVPFAPLPPEVDLHERMPPVRNQGPRSTCVAHAVSAVREFLLGERSRGADLSEQFIYWACKQRDGRPNDPGTWVKTGMEVLKEIGACPEANWPYSGALIPGNEGHGPPPATADREAAALRVADVRALSPTSVDSLRAVLAEGAPIAFSVWVFDSSAYRYTYDVGDLRLPLPGEEKYGHAMCMVGYVDDAETPGGGYFIVRNSWGPEFGIKGQVAPGYCRIPYEYVTRHGLEAYAAVLAG